MSKSVQERQAVVCRSKVKYLNMVSAERAKKALTIGFGYQMEIYRCGQSKHFHLTHKNPEERIGHGNQLKEKIR